MIPFKDFAKEAAEEFEKQLEIVRTQTEEEFVEDWWSKNEGLADSPFGSNGQLEEVPYYLYKE